MKASDSGGATEGSVAVVPPSHRDILTKRGFALVATVAEDRAPQVTPVWFREEQGAVVFSTTKGRRKYRNLESNPAIAVCIMDPDDPYRYVELRGRAQIDDDPGGDLLHVLSERYTGHRFSGDVGDRVIVRAIPDRVLVY